MNVILRTLAGTLVLICGVLILLGQASLPATTKPAPTSVPGRNGGGPPPPPPMTIEDTIRAKIDVAIGLLEQQRYDELIRLLAPAADVARMQTSGEWGKVVTDFGTGPKAAQLLTALKATKDQVLVFDNGGMRAGFVPKDPPVTTAPATQAATPPATSVAPPSATASAIDPTVEPMPRPNRSNLSFTLEDGEWVLH